MLGDDLGTLVVKEAGVPPERIDEAVQRQVLGGGALDTVLLEMGLVDETRVLEMIARLAGLRAVGKADIDRVDPTTTAIFPRRLAEKHGFLPIELHGRRLSVALAGAPDIALLDEIGFTLSVYVRPVMTTEARIAYGLCRLYGTPLSPRMESLLALLGEDPGAIAESARTTSTLRAPTAAAPRAATDETWQAKGEPVRLDTAFLPAPLALEGTDVSGWEVVDAGQAAAVDTTVLHVPPTAPARAAGEMLEGGASHADAHPTMWRPDEADPEERRIEEARRRDRVLWTVDDAIAELALTGDRDGMLDVLLRFAYRRLQAAAVFVLHRGVKAAFQGWDIIDPVLWRSDVEAISIPATGPHVLAQVVSMRSPFLGPMRRDDPLARALGRHPRAIVLVPVLVGEHLVAVVYGDCGARSIPPSSLAELHMVAPRLGKALGNLIVRKKREAHRRHAQALASSFSEDPRSSTAGDPERSPDAPSRGAAIGTGGDAPSGESLVDSSIAVIAKASSASAIPEIELDLDDFIDASDDVTEVDMPVSPGRRQEALVTDVPSLADEPPAVSGSCDRSQDGLTLEGASVEEQSAGGSPLEPTWSATRISMASVPSGEAESEAPSTAHAPEALPLSAVGGERAPAPAPPRLGLLVDGEARRSRNGVKPIVAGAGEPLPPADDLAPLAPPVAYEGFVAVQPLEVEPFDVGLIALDSGEHPIAPPPPLPPPAVRSPPLEVAHVSPPFEMTPVPEHIAAARRALSLDGAPVDHAGVVHIAMMVAADDPAAVEARAVELHTPPEAIELMPTTLATSADRFAPASPKLELAPLLIDIDAAHTRYALDVAAASSKLELQAMSIAIADEHVSGALDVAPASSHMEMHSQPPPMDAALVSDALDVPAAHHDIQFQTSLGNDDDSRSVPRAMARAAREHDAAEEAARQASIGAGLLPPEPLPPAARPARSSVEWEEDVVLDRTVVATLHGDAGVASTAARVEVARVEVARADAGEEPLPPELTARRNELDDDDGALADTNRRARLAMTSEAHGCVASAPAAARPSRFLEAELPSSVDGAPVLQSDERSSPSMPSIAASPSSAAMAARAVADSDATGMRAPRTLAAFDEEASQPSRPPPLVAGPAPSPGAKARESVLLATWNAWLDHDDADLDDLVGRLHQHGDAGRSAIVTLTAHGERAMPSLARYFPGVLVEHPFGHTDQRLDVGAFSDACACLTRLGPDLAAPILVGELAHDDRLHRYTAVWCLSELHVPAALPRLAQRIFDPELRITLVALEVLESYRDEPAMPKVLAQVRDLIKRGDTFQRRRAILAAAELRDRDAPLLLVDLLGTRPKEIAEEARRALAEITKQDFGSSERRWRAWISDNQAAPRARWLIQGLSHKELAIRKSAQHDLNRLTGQYFGYRFDASRSEREHSVQLWNAWWAEQTDMARWF